jgi:Dolichyl-phosphate-mannose-protein mannosyltransferase
MPVSSPNRARGVGHCAIAFLVVHTGLLAWEARRWSPAFDEVAHLAAGMSHWQLARFDLYRVNPPLIRMLAAVPVLLSDANTDWRSYSDLPRARAEFTIGGRFARINRERTFWYLTIARWACIPVSLIGALVCFCWARALYGDLSGLVALALWCFCPNIVAYGGLITPDAGAAAFGALAAFAFWRWLAEPSWGRVLSAGLTLGLAELTKSTWTILFGISPAVAVAWSLAHWRPTQSLAGGTPKRSVGTREWWFSKAHEDESEGTSLTSISGTGAATEFWRIQLRLVGQVAAILVLGFYVLNLGYGFEDSFRRLGDFRFVSKALGGPAADNGPANRFKGTWLASVPIPVPANYLLGIDVQRHDFETRKWSYLRGEQKLGGWWYYYLYAMGVKIPVGSLLLFAIAAILTARRLWAQGWRSCMDDLAVLAPAIAVFLLVSSQTGFNRYLRYVLPAFPFLFVWASQVVRGVRPAMTRSSFGAESDASEPPAGGTAINEGASTASTAISPEFVPGHPSSRSKQGDHWVYRAAVMGLLCWSIISSLTVYPHSLSYFNEIAGGPTNGPAHLLDANIDWGQDLLNLKSWHDAHPEARPFYLSYFGFADPQIVGFDFSPIPTIDHNHDPRRLPSANETLRQGWYAISVNHLYGYRHFGGETDQNAYLRKLRPVARVGYSILIFRVGNEGASKRAFDHQQPK